ncbi:MAG: DUF3795 domain-containing protein [candidate division Zixibacteria bacterium]|nr:DUF3795 domain-containing protein [candidate division Zixibacteria bacterium]
MERLLGACGLACDACPAYVATRENDAEMIAAIAARWSEEYGHHIKPEYVWCEGCLTEAERKCGRARECDVRACALERGLPNCAHCDDYGCEVLAGHFEMAPEAKAALENIRANL